MRDKKSNRNPFLKKVNLIADKINSGARWIILLAMIIMTPVVFANVVLRFLLGRSLPWSPEVSRYCFVWITFLGTAVAVRENSHAKVTLLLEKAPKTLGKYLKLINYIIMVGVSVLLIISGVKQTILIWPTCAAYMRFLSMSWVYISIPICGFLMLFFTCVSIIELFVEKTTSDRGEEKEV